MSRKKCQDTIFFKSDFNDEYKRMNICQGRRKLKTLVTLGIVIPRKPLSTEANSGFLGVTISNVTLSCSQ